VFDEEYLRRYGHANSAADVEIVVLHSLATLQHAAAPRSPGWSIAAAAPPRGDMASRPIFFLEEDRFLDARIHDRYALAPSFTGEGPALIVEYGSRR